MVGGGVEGEGMRAPGKPSGGLEPGDWRVGGGRHPPGQSKHHIQGSLERCEPGVFV